MMQASFLISVFFNVMFIFSFLKEKKTTSFDERNKNYFKAFKGVFFSLMFYLHCIMCHPYLSHKDFL